MFLRASFCFTREAARLDFLHVLHERKIRQETSLNTALQLIVYVFATGTTEVEILVHGKALNKIRRGTLQPNLQGRLPRHEIDD